MTTFHFQLKNAFYAIQAIKGKSGWTWSNTTGASIGADMDAAWTAFIQVNPAAKPFRNKGWAHLSTMTTMMPATVKGTHVFRPSQGISGINPGGPAAESAREGSPPWDPITDDADSDLEDDTPERASSEPAPIIETQSDDSGTMQVRELCLS